MTSVESLTLDLSRCKTCPGLEHSDLAFRYSVGSPVAVITATPTKLLDGLTSCSGLGRWKPSFLSLVSCNADQTPSAEQIAACAQWLESQIVVLHPKVIVAVGQQVVLHLTGKTVSDASRPHVKSFKFGDVLVMPTYHPFEAAAGERLMTDLRLADGLVDTVVNVMPNVRKSGFWPWFAQSGHTSRGMAVEHLLRLEAAGYEKASELLCSIS